MPRRQWSPVGGGGGEWQREAGGRAGREGGGRAATASEEANLLRLWRWVAACLLTSLAAWLPGCLATWLLGYVCKCSPDMRTIADAPPFASSPTLSPLLSPPVSTFPFPPCTRLSPPSSSHCVLQLITIIWNLCPRLCACPSPLCLLDLSQELTSLTCTSQQGRRKVCGACRYAAMYVVTSGMQN